MRLGQSAIATYDQDQSDSLAFSDRRRASKVSRSVRKGDLKPRVNLLLKLRQQFVQLVDPVARLSAGSDLGRDGMGVVKGFKLDQASLELAFEGGQ
jgi:hypothetical protein